MPDKINIYDVGDRYDPSESDGEYDEREQKLLNKIRDRKGAGKFGTGADSGEEEVLGFDDEDDDYDDDEEHDFDEIRKFEHDSDIEDKEDDDDLPDRKAWGSKARDFYGADYVDQDYDSLTAQEEERARLEEIEAREIQQRLAKELNEADFSLDIFVPEQEAEVKRSKKKKKEGVEIKLTTDLSDLSERQKRELFRKEAPEFDGLVEDFEKNLQECHEVLEPVLEYLKEKQIVDHPFVKLLKARYDLSLSYCNNISFYLLLKSKRIKIQNHPVVKRLVQMKQLLVELYQKYENSIKPQVESILKHIASGTELMFDEQLDEEKPEQPRKKLAMLERMEKSDESSEDDDVNSVLSELEDDSEPTAKKVRLDSSSEENGDVQEADADEGEVVEGKRKITYQMAKNKGLTPHKKKDQRNIRVKNRRKFQKALVRRKGTIRPVRTETTRYGGEATGIKTFVRRSVKLK
ncbi:something about silencing protein 10 [Topomyia yanbarensis]|uniref:something about silencing protein 10 n=1 Tax=Topomyia yanbarensis TaxID=2498891 RepID=UPI00273AB6B8|nr:something about silencing protein 10 [Topomyia yanbarensis]